MGLVSNSNRPSCARCEYSCSAPVCKVGGYHLFALCAEEWGSPFSPPLFQASNLLLLRLLPVALSAESLAVFECVLPSHVEGYNMVHFVCGGENDFAMLAPPFLPRTHNPFFVHAYPSRMRHSGKGTSPKLGLQH